MFSLGMDREFFFYKEYKKLIKNSVASAKELNINKCQKCGNCCTLRPGTLCEHDIINIANFLHTSIRELCKNYLAIDVIQNILTVVPIRTNQKYIAGEFISDNNSWDMAPCIFLEIEKKKDSDIYSTKCKIHKAKPEGCKKYKVCISSKPYISKWEKSQMIKYFDKDEVDCIALPGETK